MSQTQRGELVVFPDAAAVADDAARRFTALAQAAIAERERFTVALSGGSTPRAMYQRLAAPPFSSAIDWERVFVYWGDERMVPPDDADSSYRMARDTLLEHVPIPAANIVPAPTVGGTPADAARAYAETMVAQFGQDVPQFDLILLGIGPDGHTASLFPGQPEPSAPSDDLVVAVYDSPKPPPDRISFTYRLINAARAIMFVVTGADKASALDGILHGPPNRAHLPAQGVQPTAGNLVWLVDQAATAH